MRKRLPDPPAFHHFDADTYICRGCGMAMEDYCDNGLPNECPDDNRRPHLMAAHRLEVAMIPVMREMGYELAETMH